MPDSLSAEELEKHLPCGYPGIELNPPVCSHCLVRAHIAALQAAKDEEKERGDYYCGRTSDLTYALNAANEKLSALQSRVEELEADRGRLLTARPLDEHHEDFGSVLWHKFPINEPPYVGDPNCSDWPGYHTHWTPLPDCNKIQEMFDAAMRGKGEGMSELADNWHILDKERLAVLKDRIHALTAENAELKSKLEEAKKELYGYPAVADRNYLRQSLARVEEENAELKLEIEFLTVNIEGSRNWAKVVGEERDALRTALEIYGDKESWDCSINATLLGHECQPYHSRDYFRCPDDGYDFARAALDAGEGKK